MTDEPTTEDLKAAALDTIAHGIQDYIAASRPKDDGVYVTAWLVSAEWTSVTLERAGWPGQRFINPRGQGLAVTRGLSELASDFASMFTETTDDEDDEDDDED